MAGILMDRDPQDTSPESSQPDQQPHIRFESMSAAKRQALVTCLRVGGTLQRQRGVWVPSSASSSNKPIAGVTINALVRDGLIVVTSYGRRATARLTERGREAAIAVEAVERERARTRDLSSLTSSS